MSSSITLYEKLGGEAGIESLVSAFFDRVMHGGKLSSFFKDGPIAHVRTMQREFFAMALDGPVTTRGDRSPTCTTAAASRPGISDSSWITCWPR